MAGRKNIEGGSNGSNADAAVNVRERKNVDEINGSRGDPAGIKANDYEPQVAERQISGTEGKIGKERMEASLSQSRQGRQ